MGREGGGEMGEPAIVPWIGGSGPDNPRWKGGKQITAKGYVRITAGEDRFKFEHRVISEKILGGPLPEGMEVHHMDGRKDHNCVGNWETGHPGNLLLIDARLHRWRWRGEVASREKRNQEVVRGLNVIDEILGKE